MDEQTQSVNETELDLGLETLTPVAPQIDYEAAIAKAKPDFQRIVKLLGIQPTGSTQEEVDADILTKQKAFEEDLKTNTVPKIKSALEALTAKAAGNSSTKPGVSVNFQPQQAERKVKSWKGY
ncbi:MAG: hypothetical protein RMZ43_002970 [Nostoc sp. CmiVER01]|uniref:hypothetical protein n=1 Tax=Nostoc sp. CmiVER01 TaxID=3075384 RepID=UPI002AD4C37F|nr:hypothetical protein [Nostoc sp. CmiVER01]MDZ8124749.1 hypothetical protein [Nostoc sp. CmiVER01]